MKKFEIRMKRDASSDPPLGEGGFINFNYDCEVIVDGVDITTKVVDVALSFGCEDNIPRVTLTVIPDEIIIEGAVPEIPMPISFRAPLRAFVLEDGGVSSVTIVQALVPEFHDLCAGRFPGSLGRPPLDWGDFHRCLRALDLIPPERGGIVAVAKRLRKREWELLALHWSELEQLHLSHDHKRFNERLQELYEEADRG